VGPPMSLNRRPRGGTERDREQRTDINERALLWPVCFSNENVKRETGYCSEPISSVSGKISCDDRLHMVSWDNDWSSQSGSRQPIEATRVRWGQIHLVLQVGEIEGRRIRQRNPIGCGQIQILLQRKICGRNDP
jgi:hypothetical protein